MNLLEAQQTRMPWGVYQGQTLHAILRADPTYITQFLVERIDTLDAWLREAVEIVVAEGVQAPVVDERQGELF